MTSGYLSPSDEHIELNTAPSHWSYSLLFLIIAIGTEAGIANWWKFSLLAVRRAGVCSVAVFHRADRRRQPGSDGRNADGRHGARVPSAP